MHIAKHHTHFPGFAFHGKAFRIAFDNSHHFGRNILSENAYKLLFFMGFTEIFGNDVDHEQHQDGEQGVLHGNQGLDAGVGIAKVEDRKRCEQDQDRRMDRTQDW